MGHTGYDRGPRDLPDCDVWPRERSYLLDAQYEYECITVMLKCSMLVSEAILKLHYPTLFANPMVLFCDTGEHIVVYLAKEIDNVTPIQ